MECKRGLRVALLKQRDALSASEIARRSVRVAERLWFLPEVGAASVMMFFISFGSEVDTVPMISRALTEGKRVAAPRVERRLKRLMPYEVRDLQCDLEPGAYGILEPKRRLPVMPSDAIEIVLVPAVGWDEQGFRVGYGGGYYDRLLPELPRAVRIGLGFEMQVVPRVPRGQNDLPADVLVTDDRVRQFRHRGRSR